MDNSSKNRKELIHEMLKESKGKQKGDETMIYPKKVMRKTDLMKMGFPEDMLLRASRERGQTMAWKENPIAKNSPLLFDTDELEKWRIKQTRVLSQSIVAAVGIRR